MIFPIEGENGPGAKFSVSNYRDGYYQPNGQFVSERLLSDKAITNWENETRFKPGGVWGYGQALFLKDQPLIFGRDQDQVDVKVDWDPDDNGYCVPELGVSRRHFQLQTLSETDVLMTDLGSTNGVRVYSKDGKTKAILNRSNAQTNLEVGDFTTFGGGGSELTGENGRLIGFRVCSDKKRGLFLVKFNAKNLDDLLALTGKVRQQDMSASRPVIHNNPELNSALDSSYRVLVQKMAQVRELAEDTHDPKFFIAQGELIADILSISQDLGSRFFNNDSILAATRLGYFAIEKGERSQQQGDKNNAARSAELSLFINNLVSGRLIDKVNDQ